MRCEPWIEGWHNHHVEVLDITERFEVVAIIVHIGVDGKRCIIFHRFLSLAGAPRRSIRAGYS